MKKITVSALALGIALAFAGNAQAERSFSPKERSGTSIGAAAFVAPGALAGKSGYTLKDLSRLSRR